MKQTCQIFALHKVDCRFAAHRCVHRRQQRCRDLHESDAAQIAACGVTLLSEKENEYRLKVEGEAQANRLLAKLINDGITVITFDLREPSLHEIFVEKVGEENED